MIIPEYIENPVGIDREIQKMQRYLVGKTIVETVFGKATKIYAGKDTEPCVYIGANEYEAVLQSDHLKSHLVFFVDETSKIDGIYEVFNVSIIVFADLNKNYPNIKHRGEEEIINDVKFWVESNSNMIWKLTDVTRGAKKALSIFNMEIDDFLQQNPLFTFRLDYETKIINNNNQC